MKQLLITIFGLILSNVCFAQNEVLERKPFTLELAVDTVNYYSEEIKASKYFVQEKILQIYPGEKLLIEVELKNGNIEKMKVVKENINPENTIEIDFFQNKTEKMNEGMMLKVKNPFDKTLSYKAMMFIVGHDKWIKTSIMPVRPKLLGYETWNETIITLVLEDWTLNTK
jgi:hypothetical protein